MTAIELYEKFAHESYQNSYDHGFWEEGETRSKGEMVKLMIGETSECQEAHRVSRVCNGESLDTWFAHLGSEERANVLQMTDDEMWKHWFFLNVKDTTGDELADTAIRVMDFVYGWRCHFLPRDFRKDSTGNFSHDLLRIDWYILQAFHDDVPGRDWGYVLAAVCKFADVWDIDLPWHIENKQKWNRTGPYKHAKLY